MGWETIGRIRGLDGSDGIDGSNGSPGQNGSNGTNGVDGATWRNGSGAPSNGLGANNDYYLDTANGDVHKKASGTYSIVGNIKGATGQTGQQGNPGVDGVRTATTAFGYSTGAGGTVTQGTNKSTAVTLNKLCGTITMHNAALAAGAIVSFTFNNNQVAAGDVIAPNHVSGGTFGPYLISPRVTGNGTAVVTVRNTSAGSLGEAIVIGFVVVKAVTA